MIWIVGAVLLLWTAAVARWLNDRSTDRMVEFVRRLNLNHAEIMSRLSGRKEDEDQLAAALQRLASMETSIRLTPSALGALRDRVDRLFQELQENALPPEAKEVGRSALTRMQGVRERMATLEDQSLKDFLAASEKGAPEPLIRVRAGD